VSVAARRQARERALSLLYEAETKSQSPAEIVAEGFAPEAVEQVVRLIRINEYKRRQAPPGPRITPRAFGRDWRYPVTNGFRERL